jgi:predicted Zn-dependent protease
MKGPLIKRQRRLNWPGSVLIILIGITLSGCASLGFEDVLEIAQKSAPAIQKSFEDITPEQEYYIGRAVAANILSQYQPFTEAEPTAYLNLMGSTLAFASDRPETFGGYHFLILDSQEINAFAAPGGLVFISLGLLACADSEDTVAAILAHEIAHVVKQHGLQAIKKSRVTSALTSVAIASAQTAGSDELAKLTTVFEDSIGDITATLVNSGYSRTFEKEADLMAVEILQRVGYDPNALVRMLEVMERRLTPGGLDFAKTHPEPAVRINEIRKVLAQAPAPPVQAERQARYQAALGNL